MQIINIIAPIIRIICGLILIVVSTTRYFGVRKEIALADEGQIEIFGFATTGEPWQLLLVFGTSMLVGIALISLGGFALMKKMQES